MAVKPMTQIRQLVCFGPDRAFAYKRETGRVTPFESTPNGWNLTVELDAPNDANSKLQEIMDITMIGKNLEQTKNRTASCNQTNVEGAKMCLLYNLLDDKTQTCKTTRTIVGTVDSNRRRRDNHGQSW